MLTRRKLIPLVAVICVATLLLTRWRSSPPSRVARTPNHNTVVQQDWKPGNNSVRNNYSPDLTWTPIPGIPKIIHQIWDSDIVPTQFVQNTQGLVKLNPPPEWKYYFWPLTVGRKLVERKYPSILKLYDASPNLMKADMLRLVVIHQFGGVYFDLDTVGVKPLKPFVENRTCSSVTVPPEIIIAKDMVVHVDVINNAALFCQAAHPFYDAILQELEKVPTACKSAIQCAGPSFISHIYHELKKKKENYDILPTIESYQLFLDKIPNGAKSNPLNVCSSPKYEQGEVWRKKLCDEWARRGKNERPISTLAYTYHTWFHTLTNKVTIDKTNTVKNVVPHAIIYE